MSTRSAGQRFPLRVVVAGLVLWGLAACQTSPPPAETPAPGHAAAQLRRRAAPVGAHEYQVVARRVAAADSGVSRRRHGAPRAQPRHRVASPCRASCSSPTISRRRASTSALPVNELTIDEPAMREPAGADFPPGVPQSARDGTRKNLLSEALLDGENYPDDSAACHRFVAAGEVSTSESRSRSRTRCAHVRVPVTIERKDGALVARGEFPLKQSELGFKPFSVAHGDAGGARRDADPLRSGCARINGDTPLS